MKSQYLGLWKSERTGWYLSPGIKKKDLENITKDKGRIILRYNKHHNPEKNTPNFIFAFADADTVNNTTLETEHDWYEELLGAFEKIQDLAYHGDVSHEDNYYEIDMLCRKILDKHKGEEVQ